MKRIALLNIECFVSSAAMEQIIAEHSEQIELVIASDRYKGRHGGVIKQAFDNFRRGGLFFTHYLGMNFLLHPIFAKMTELLSRFTPLKLQRKSLKRCCNEAGISFAKAANVNDPKIIALLKEHEVDLIVSFYFDQILKKEIISIPEHGVVNFHPAILPDCRGLSPVIFSAVKNDERFGITLHDIDNEAIDEGPILAIATLDPPPSKSILKLESAVCSAGVDLFRKIVHDLPKLRKESRSQSGGNYYSYPTRADLRELKKLGYKLTSEKDFFAHYLEKAKRIVDNPQQAKSATSESEK